MKALKITLLIMLIGIMPVLNLKAQPGMEDVIYLKSGNVYRGIIIEQVPNVSMKIKTMGGNVFAVTIAEIEKITKEERQMPVIGEHPFYDMHRPFFPYPDKSCGGRDSMFRDFKYRNRGRFMVLQVLVENKQGGVRLVEGFKFNTHVALGAGVGADFVFSSPFNRRINNLDSRALSGVYVPFYLHLTGDFVPWRVTPFYAVEAGYFIAGLQRDRAWDDISHKKPEAYGPMAGIGLGIKINSKKGINFGVLFNLNVKNVNYKQDVLYYDVFGNPYTVNEHKNATLLIPGVRVCFGFTATEHRMKRMEEKQQ